MADNRVDIVDIAKGISIILVAFSHSHLAMSNPELNGALGLFRVPLFFFLSGVFFSTKRSPQRFIWGKTDALLKPYFFTLMGLAVLFVVVGNDSLFHHVFGILYGNGDTIRWGTMWFLPHLWLVFVVAYGIFFFADLSKAAVSVQVAVVLLLYAVGSVVIHFTGQQTYPLLDGVFNTYGLPFGGDLLLVSMAFFLAGRFLRDIIVVFQPRIIVVGLVLAVFVSIVLWSRVAVNLNARVLNEPWFAGLAAATGIYLVLTASYLLSKQRHLTYAFRAVGRGSLFILIFHTTLDNNTYKLMNRAFCGQEACGYTDYLALCLAILIPLLMRKIVMSFDILKLAYFPLESNRLFNKWIDRSHN